jgi:membrane peptidoglycan carboxypeptidase
MIVLRQMVNNKYVTEKGARLAKMQPLKIYQSAENHGDKAPYFVNAVRRELSQKLELSGIKSSGLKIKTTLDSTLQTAIQKSVFAQLKQLNMTREVSSEDLVGAVAKLAKERPLNKAPYKPQPLAVASETSTDHIQCAVVSLDQATGAVRAMQGGDAFDHSQFNRTMFTNRPIGNLVIPFYVATAIEQGLTPISSMDEDLSSRIAGDVGGYLPSGSKIRQAAQNRRLFEIMLDGDLSEMPALALNIGQGTVADKLKKIGLSTYPAKFNVLDHERLYGATGTPLEVAKAYSALANGGFYLPHYLIESVEAADGEILYQAPKRGRPKKVFAMDAALAVANLLKLPLSHGYPSKVLKSPTFAGLFDGASRELKDSWVVHLNQGLTQVIWLGAERGSRPIDKDLLAVRKHGLSLLQSLLKAMPSRSYASQDARKLSEKRDVLGAGWSFVEVPSKTDSRRPMRIPLPPTAIAKIPQRKNFQVR